ncbi:MAG: hypothetical protein JO107_04065 [Hyphomicrobiales bacterium]|nr:hypothetical protein [Hyphomicrobiales bacterium]
MTLRTATIAKNKDGEEGAALAFTMRKIAIERTGGWMRGEPTICFSWSHVELRISFVLIVAGGFRPRGDFGGSGRPLGQQARMPHVVARRFMLLLGQRRQRHGLLHTRL